MCCNDKLLQIYFVGLKILATALGNPVCGEDIPIALINSSVRRFVPLLVTKISELNYRARDMSMHTLISLFNHPSVDLKILIDNLVDIADAKLPVEKQQWRVVLARLEIMICVLRDFGLNEKVWNWRTLCQRLVFPSLLHQNPDVRYMCVELIINLYKLVGEEVKNELIKMKSVKASLLQSILEKMADAEAGKKRVGPKGETALKLAAGKDLATVEEEKDDASNLPSSELRK